jgi:hypothetical protein
MRRFVSEVLQKQQDEEEEEEEEVEQRLAIEMEDAVVYLNDRVLRRGGCRCRCCSCRCIVPKPATMFETNTNELRMMTVTGTSLFGTATTI